MYNSPIRVPFSIRWHIRVIGLTPIAPLALLAFFVSLGWLPYRTLHFMLFFTVFGSLIVLREIVRRLALSTCRKAIGSGEQGQTGSIFCLNCGFELQKLNPAGQCPECGSWYSAADVQRVWLDCECWLRGKRTKT